jgi:hypothetical protein
MLNTHSLRETINEVNEVALFSGRISEPSAKQISEFIAGRQGLPHSYYGLFAPLDDEVKKPFPLFTGETIRSDASARHILGEESLRILKVLGDPSTSVQQAIERAQEDFGRKLMSNKALGYGVGTYCCGNCTVAYWRALTTRWIADAGERLEMGMKDLKNARNAGKWRRFPFYYTALCLTELEKDIAREEIHYIQPTCERALKFLRAKDAHYQQKSAILAKILETA